MPLSLSQRQLGNVTVVQCSGRIVTGPEVESLRDCVRQILQECEAVVLNLGDVSFVDSSGLGMLVRLLTSTRASGRRLRFCSITPQVQNLLRMTNLLAVLEPHTSEEDAISALYSRGNGVLRSEPGGPLILCVDQSPDVLAYLGALLRRAGYQVLTNANIYDSLILIRASGPDLILLGPNLQAAPGTIQSFRGACSNERVLELGADFSTDDAGEAGSKLLQRIAEAFRSTRSALRGGAGQAV